MRVYSDGKNSVTVSGDFTVKYLENDPVRYEELSALGVFDGDSSEKIFEDNNKGFLA